MNRRAAYWLGLLGVIAAALFLRGGDLSLRPLHNDEAINAFKLRELWAEGTYRYDPHEYHGPSLYFLSLPVLQVAALRVPDQPEVAAMRSVAVLCGLGLVGVALLAGGSLGRGGALAAAGFTAVSPAMVYYSRYYIHELMLVLFTGGVLLALEWYRRRPGWGASACIGAGVGLMYATKETFVFAVAAMIAGGVVAAVAADPAPGTARGAGARTRAVVRTLVSVPRAHVAVALLVFAVVSALFFTSFLRHPAGAVDAVRTYLIWGERAGGATPHVHPWSFHLERLVWFRFGNGPVWTEAGVLALAAAGVTLGWRKGGPGGCGPVPVRVLAGFTVALAAVYAAIPYKTPWCLLGFHHGLILLAGVGAAALIGARPGWLWRMGTGCVVVVVAAHLGVQAWRMSRLYAADFRNPHVYGHTSADIFNLLELIEGVAAAQPEGRGLPMAVAAPESNYWPLPWYLRRFGQVGWWDRVPDPMPARLLVSAVKLQARLEETTQGAWIQVGMFELRPRYFVEVHVEAAAWKRFLAARAAGRGP